MNQAITIVLTVLITAAFTALVMSLLTASKKADINLDTVLGKAVKIYGVADTLAAVIAPFLPEPYSTIVYNVFRIADKAVHIAENAWKDGKLASDERKEKATSIVYKDLGFQNIEIDDKVKSLTDNAIESLVKTLPKSHTIEAQI